MNCCHYHDFWCFGWFFSKIHAEYGALRKSSDEGARDSSASDPQDQPDKAATSSDALALPGILDALFYFVYLNL